jgi:Flp pilus assembly protein TadB
MVALIVLVVVLLAVAVVAADRGVKARKRARLRRLAADRLATAMAGAEATEQERRARQEASGALTSVMPAIYDRGPRRV